MLCGKLWIETGNVKCTPDVCLSCHEQEEAVTSPSVEKVKFSSKRKRLGKNYKEQQLDLTFEHQMSLPL